MKKILVILAGFVLALHLTGCTDSKDDNADQSAASADAAAMNPDSPNKAAPDEAQAGFLDDQLPEDALGSAPKDAKTTTPPAATDQMATTTPPSDAAAPAPANDLSLEDDATKTPPPPATTDMAAADTSAPPPPPEAVAAAPTKPSAPLQKIKDAPFKQDAQLLNAVYIARPGDTFKSISTMVYGTADHANDLKTANPGLSKAKPGQKVYYNSPTRPQDDAKLLNYYEDTGVTPQVYVAKEGDNLRKVSKDLLGYPEAWKEVWATNPVESKGALPAGTELRYWKGVSPSVPTLAGADNAAGAGALPPPPPTNEAMNTPPPPPPPQAAAAAGTAANATPPPPPQAQAANNMPPPPPPQAQVPPPPVPAQGGAAAMPKKPKAPAMAAQMPEDDETIYMMAGAGAIAVAAAGYFIVRRRRAQKAAAGYETHADA